MLGRRRQRWYTKPDLRPTAGDEAFPPALPNPMGWFCIGFSDEVRPGQVVTRRLVDGDVVLYRTRKGLLRATEAYCPHLGAHLGVGGAVEGENLVCPFHRFAYAPDGTCVKTAYGTRPPKARLRQLEVREINGGIIFVWYDHDGAGPHWELPEVDLTGYSPLVHITVDMPTHPQEVGENTVDEGHFPVMHKSPILEIRPYNFTGHVLGLNFTMRVPLPHLPRAAMTVTYDGELHGLGYTAGSMTLKAGPVLRGWIMPTVVGPWRIQLRFAACLRLPAPRWLPPRLGQALAYAAARALCDIGLRATAAGFVLNDDSPIWHTKRYQPAPRLADGDGPIMAYRRWAQQFYPGRHQPADEQKGSHAASLPSDRQAPLLLPRTPRTPSAG
ncbi:MULTISPECIES: Rieske 2Fe-2S domain-containing protein [Streptomyces]|uniref:cholesterol 7-desaturase n=2 Tax=Streptomyces TaxID=1883 RepID=A0ABV9J6Z6_9ACTN